MTDKPYSGMPGKSKREELFLQKSSEEIEIWKNRFEARLKNSSVSERGLGFSLLNNIQKGNIKDINVRNLLKINYKIWWMADCVAWAILNEFGYVFDHEEREDIFAIDQDILRQKSEFLQKLKEKNLEQYSLYCPYVILLNSEIRKILGKPRLSNQQIHELMLGLSQTKIERKSCRFNNDNLKQWFRLGEFNEIVGDIKFVETGNYSHKTKVKDRLYFIIFENENSLDFYYSVLTGFFDFRKRNYYSMSKGAQLIYRLIGWNPRPTFLRLDQLCLIAQKTTKYKPMKKKYIEENLSELKEKKYIKGWSEKNNMYTIFKVSRKVLPK